MLHSTAFFASEGSGENIPSSGSQVLATFSFVLKQ